MQERLERTASGLTLGTIGRITRPVTDIKRAEIWYKEVLGLTHLYTFDKLAFFDCGGIRLMLEERSLEHRSIGGVPDCPYESVVHFRVADIHDAYDELCRRGARFSGTPSMLGKHPDGTEEWIAFFKDCEGGPLAIMSQVKPA